MWSAATTTGLSAVYAGLDWITFGQFAITLLPIWLFGAIVGFLLPRPKWTQNQTARSGAILLTTPPGSGARRIALLYHAAVLVREIWYCFVSPGTFRRLLRACWSSLRGKGWEFQWRPGMDQQNGHSHDKSIASHCLERENWHIKYDDWEFFKDQAEHHVELPGASRWEKVMEKEISHKIRYVAWRRWLPNGKTEYKSVTIVPDTSAREALDFYLDDPTRQTWDGMLTHTETLEAGDFERRQQVVRWVRSFPFGFLSDREYIIARQVFEDDGVMYGITKAADCKAAPRTKGLVRTEEYWSMWRNRSIADPWGGEGPACETLLLHHENMKVPEQLARFAVKHGMWGFVKNMSPAMTRFVEQRRRRADPDAADAQAYGFDDSERLQWGQGADAELHARSSASAPAARASPKAARGAARLVHTGLAVAAVVWLSRKARDTGSSPQPTACRQGRPLQRGAGKARQ